METKTNKQTYERKNRFTGESIQLTLEEAKKHDQIFEPKCSLLLKIKH
jgi:hypothetical protein